MQAQIKIICHEESDDWYLCLGLFVFTHLVVRCSSCKPVSLRATSGGAVPEENCLHAASTAFLSELHNASPSPGYQPPHPAILWQWPGPRENKIPLFQGVQEIKCK